VETPELWTLMAATFAGTFIWRALGPAIAAHINPDSAVFQWVSCVAYAMLAGLIARILILPIGILAESPTLDRVIAMLAGFTLFFTFRRHVFAGAMGAFGVFLALSVARDAGVF